MLKNFVEHLKQKNFNVCVVYLLDSQVLYKFYFPSTTYSYCSEPFCLTKDEFCLDQFITDVTKFISGCMSSLAAMIQLELPHVNILSKMDLLQDKSNIDEYVFLFFALFSFVVVSILLNCFGFIVTLVT